MAQAAPCLLGAELARRLQRGDLRDADRAVGDVVAEDRLQQVLLVLERLLGQQWLVIASTVAMLAVMLIGIAMGFPRLRNNLAGWHKGAA